MRLVVGLGNPGTRYRETPHNAGFRVCDGFADRHRMDAEEGRFRGRFRRGRVRGEDVGVLKPETYMNLSGESVAEALRYLPAGPQDLIVVYDEMDLPAGKLRIRPGGGHGGHNGMRSVIEQLGGFRDFPRLRVGVGRPPEGRDATGHLLSRLRAEQRERFDATVRSAIDALDAILIEGVAEAMNRYNGLPAVGEEEEEAKA
jgi:PTH1 family peptidyl-tRNA hydrolase